MLCAHAMAQELNVRRVWDPAQHPRWLAFEVEGQLQIRPVQYTIARHLMQHMGDVVQLNMGEGKTRVILPMLALHGADGSCVVRSTAVRRHAMHMQLRGCTLLCLLAATAAACVCAASAAATSTSKRQRLQARLLLLGCPCRTDLATANSSCSAHCRCA